MGTRRCPRAGQRVRFEPNPAARMFYDKYTPKPGTEGTITTLPGPGGRISCLPGPRGGMVYVDWDNGHTEGVFKNDLAPAKKRRK